MRSLLLFTALFLPSMVSNGAAAPREERPPAQGTAKQDRVEQGSLEREMYKQIELGPRPAYLIESMRPGPLKDALQRCAAEPAKRSRFSISHRGAPLQFPEHSREGYLAAAKMGAGVLECDVTVTKDGALVCRHSACDLHQTTDILLRPALAAKCSQPFQPADPARRVEAKARCCVSDLELSEFKGLCARMDEHNSAATRPEEYLSGGPRWRSALYRGRCGRVMTHGESISLARDLGMAMTPEMKAPAAPLTESARREISARFIQEYRSAGVPDAELAPQSFELDEIKRWRSIDPSFAARAVYLEGRILTRALLPRSVERLEALFAPLKALDIQTIGAPLWLLAEAGEGEALQISRYARTAAKMGFRLIAWTLERSPPRSWGERDWYYQGLGAALPRDGDLYRLLHFLDRRLPLVGVFSDWPATVSRYASCEAARRLPLSGAL